MKQSLFDRIFSLIEKHSKKILIAIVLSIVVSPIIIEILYPRIRYNLMIEITAGELLSYIGAVISGIISLFVAFVALYQSRKNHELEVELNQKIRRNEIFPNLQVKLQTTDNDNFKITISNVGSNKALQVSLYEYFYSPIICANKSISKNITFNHSVIDGISIDSSIANLNEDGYPSKITIVCSDLDNNWISMEYRFTNELIYEFSGKDYL